MRTLKSLGSLLVSALLVTNASFAADIQAGRHLHEKNCTACHASLMKGKPTLVYTRPNRRVKSYDGLLAQVRRCVATLGSEWPQRDIENLAAFLNTTYYKFR